jgi:hypothetical protein
VSLENNGGFIQMALDLDPGGRAVDCSAFTGVEVEVFGTGETYGMHLRTSGLDRPWQSYRQSFLAEPVWRTVRLSFASFLAHRTDLPFDSRAIRRISLVAIGRAFRVDLSLSAIRFV